MISFAPGKNVKNAATAAAPVRTFVVARYLGPILLEKPNIASFQTTENATKE